MPHGCRVGTPANAPAEVQPECGTQQHNNNNNNKAQLRTDGGTSPLMAARHNSDHEYDDGISPVSEG